jgi:hypothetical protein
MTMLVDIEKVSAKDLTRIIATKEGLDAALKARAKAQGEVDRCREVLRSLGVGLDGEMPADPEPRGAIPNGGAVIPARNPVTGRTRKARAARPRAGIKLDAAVVASVRQALEAASGPRTTAELVEATELRAPVVIAACREIGATQVAKGRGTKWNLCARVPIPADDDEPAEGDVADEDDEDEGELA